MVNLNKKITEHFIYKEVLYCDSLKYYVPIKPYQEELIQMFFEEVVEPIRLKVGKMKITSGVRNKKVIEALEKNNYSVSVRTDHSYLDPEVNQWGCGAIDFIPMEQDIEKVFWNICKDYFFEGWPIGQIILYNKEVRGVSFIHLSYDKKKLFTDKLSVVQNIQKKKFLICSRINKEKLIYSEVVEQQILER